jgi:pyridoxamine 5'-phosphate oxidase
MSSADPITEFLNAVERAKSHQVDPAPVALATADAQGRPSVRMVLLRGADTRGFSFFTNYNSRKGRELDRNPHAALCFHWATLDEQIRVEGSIERLPDAESDEYFAHRPRGSQLGAWASAQSEMLPSRETLEEKYREIERRFEHEAHVPRPPFWGGYRLIPHRIEFWYGRTDRLHDRVVYVREASTWRIERLYP